MAWVSAVIGGLSALHSADQGKSAGKKAKKGAKQQLEFARESRDLALAMSRHQRQSGATALNAMMSMTGLSGSGGGVQYDENGWPIENTGGGLGLGGGAGAEAPDIIPTAPRISGGQSRYGAYDALPRYGGGPMGQNTVYNVNELGPENRYVGGRVTRNPNPMTIDGETGYVQPNRQGQPRTDYRQDFGGYDPNRTWGGGMPPPRLFPPPQPGGGMPSRQGQPRSMRRGRFGRPRIAGRGIGGFLSGKGGSLLGSGPLGALSPDMGYLAYKQHEDRNDFDKVRASPTGTDYEEYYGAKSDIDTTQGMDYNFQTDPGYQFRFEEGQRALDRGAAARGGLLSGGYGRKAMRYGQGFASNEFSNVYNRIANIAGMGQVANQQAGNYAMMGGQGMGNAAANMGIASAYGTQLGSNAWQSGAQSMSQLPWGQWFGGNQGGNQGMVGSPMDQRSP